MTGSPFSPNGGGKDLPPPDLKTRLHDLLKARGRYWISVFFFVIIVGTLLYGFIYANTQLAYTWRWYRVPEAIYVHATIEIEAEIEGEVESIVPEEDHFLVTVTGMDGTESYQTPEGTLMVEEGDYLYPGDNVGSYQEWMPGLLLQGLWVTLYVSLISIFFGIIIGLIVGLARISKEPAIKWLAMIYVEFIRGTPLLVQIFIWAYVFGAMIDQLLLSRGASQLPSIVYGGAGLAFFAGAYVAEIVRAGIQSIHKGQMEAARSLGMSYPQSMRHIILPQAFRRIIPPLAGQFISLVKDSSLLGIIAIRELTKATREVVTTSLQPFELWFVCALLYLTLTFTLSMFLQYLERRTLAT
jgi:polar amino acid transport system permease protein